MSAKSRTADTYEQIKLDLLNARYIPGAKLKIDQIREDLGVSPSAVREALSRLTSEGLVQAEPQRGFIVAPISAEDLRDLTAVRIEIETRCLRCAIAAGDVAWEGRILSALHQLRARPAFTRDAEGRMQMSADWTDLHSAFHDALVAACDSRWWLALRDQLFLQAERYRRLLGPYIVAERDTESEHVAIAEATIARDADKACSLLARHLALTAEQLLASDAPFEALAAKARGPRPS